MVSVLTDNLCQFYFLKPRKSRKLDCKSFSFHFIKTKFSCSSSKFSNICHSEDIATRPLLLPPALRFS